MVTDAEALRRLDLATMTAPPQRPVHAWHVATFYILACALSWPFFWMRDMEPETFGALPVPPLFRMSLIMWGPGISALVCLKLFSRSHTRRITLVGTSAWRSVSVLAVPFFCLSLLELAGFELPPHDVNLALVPVVVFASIVGEEVGWRGFLQDALQGWPPRRRYMVMGLMWEAWHFTNRTSQGPLLGIVVRVSIFAALCMLWSWLMGVMVEHTRSILVATAVHTWIDELFEANAVVWVGFLVFVVLTAALWKRWPQPVDARANPLHGASGSG